MQTLTVTAATTNGVPVTQFNQPITLVIHYLDANLTGIDETKLELYYWHAGQQAWVLVPATIDAANNVVTATLNHLTTFAMLQGTGVKRSLYLPAITH